MEDGAAELAFPLSDRDEIWDDDAPRLYAQAAAAQWDPATAVPWGAALAHDDDVEAAVCQVMTYLVENETAALLVPARFLAQVHPHYREVVALLAIQAADEARHVEVFTRRATLRTGRLGTSSRGGQASLATLVTEPSFPLATFLLSVMGEASFLELLRFLAAEGPDEVTRTVCRLAAQDEARHVAFAVGHLRRQCALDPGLRGRLATAVRARDAALRHTSGLNDDVFDALVVLAAGGWTAEALGAGFERVVALVARMDRARRGHLLRLGFDEAEAEALSALHAPSCEPGRRHGLRRLRRAGLAGLALAARLADGRCATARWSSSTPCRPTATRAPSPPGPRAPRRSMRSPAAAGTSSASSPRPASARCRCVRCATSPSPSPTGAPPSCAASPTPAGSAAPSTPPRTRPTARPSTSTASASPPAGSSTAASAAATCTPTPARPALAVLPWRAHRGRRRRLRPRPAPVDGLPRPPARRRRRVRLRPAREPPPRPRRGRHHRPRRHRRRPRRLPPRPARRPVVARAAARGRRHADDRPPLPRRVGDRTLRIGIAGGRLKPSTGYGVQRILADADAVATSLERHGHPFDLPRDPPALQRLDAVLLRVIRDEPERMVDIFGALTANNPAPRVLRFLGEHPELLDLLGIVTGLPVGPFLRAMRP
ncbi:MAG: lycopene cyclase family protein [Myxococcota bacterium]